MEDLDPEPLLSMRATDMTRGPFDLQLLLGIEPSARDEDCRIVLVLVRFEAEAPSEDVERTPRRRQPIERRQKPVSEGRPDWYQRVSCLDGKRQRPRRDDRS